MSEEEGSGARLKEEGGLKAWELLRAGTILCLPTPTPFDWELLEDRHFAFSIRPVTPRVGGVLPPLSST